MQNGIQALALTANLDYYIIDKYYREIVHHITSQITILILLSELIISAIFLLSLAVFTASLGINVSFDKIIFKYFIFPFFF